MLAALGGCAAAPGESLVASAEVVRTLARETADVIEVARFSRGAPGAMPEGWEPYIILPSKPRTEYRLARVDGEVALEANAEASASGLVRVLRADPATHPVLEWRWRVPALIPGANQRVAWAEDSPARLIVSFHGDEAKLDFAERAELRLARALSGRALPYAILMYVWSNDLPVGSIVRHPRTERVRSIVVGSGRDGLGEWRSYWRDVREDFVRAFGEEPWDIVAVGLMTDADNTRQKARCIYGDITLRRRAP